MKKICLASVVFFMLLSIGVLGINSSTDEFKVTPNTLYLNWTNNYSENLTIQNLNDTRNITVDIHNSSSPLEHYLKSYDATLKVKVNNAYINETIFVGKGSSNVTTLYTNISSLLAGRYFGSLFIDNSTNQNENATVNVTLDVPINLSTGVGEFKGNITNDTENIFYFNTSSIQNVAGLRINLTDLESDVALSLYDNSGNLKKTIITNGSQKLNYIFSSFPPRSSYWYVKISNDTISSPATFNGTVELLQPSLMVNTTGYPNGTFDFNTLDSRENTTLTDSLGFNKTLKEYFVVKNLANYNLTYTVVDSSFLNYSSSYIQFSHNFTDGAILSNSQKTVEVDLTLDTTKAKQSGLYKGWILINTTNGYPYREFNLSLVANLTNSLDVHITKIETSDGNNWIEDASAPQNITIFSNVYLVNGTELTDLNVSDFSLHLSNVNKTHTISLSNLFNYTSSLYNGGKYEINATLPSNQIGGYYNAYLSVNPTRGAISLLGSTHNGTLVVNNTALWLEANDEDFTIDEGYSDTFKLTVTNYGPKTAKGKIELTESCTGFSLETDSLESNCGSVEESSGGSPGFNVNIGEGKTCWYKWSLIAGSVSSDKSCDLGLSVSDAHLNGMSISVEIKNIETPQTTTNTTTTTTTISGENKIEIKSYPATLKITKGESENFKIGVMNTGDNNLEDLALSISGIPSNWYTFTPSKIDLDKGNEKTFDITITPTLDTTIGKRNITFSVGNDNVNSSKHCSLSILPTDVEKIKINNTYTDYQWNYTQLKNEMLKFGKEVDVSELNSTLRQIKSELDTVGNFISKGDYISANEHLDEAKFLFSQAKKQKEDILSLKRYATGDISKMIWIIVGVVVITVIGIVIYLALPPREEYRLSGRVPRHIKYKPPSSFNSIPRKVKLIIVNTLRKIKYLFLRR